MRREWMVYKTTRRIGKGGGMLPFFFSIMFPSGLSFYVCVDNLIVVYIIILQRVILYVCDTYDISVKVFMVRGIIYI